MQEPWIEPADIAASMVITHLGGAFSADYDDLRQIAQIAGWQAHRTWRGDHPDGLSYQNWIIMRARGAAIDALRRTSYGSFQSRMMFRLLRTDDPPGWVLRDLTSLDATDDQGRTVGDTLEGNVDLDRDLAAADAQATLAHLLEQIPAREAAIVALYFYDEYTQAQIAATVGVSESRISQLLTAALGRLRRLADPDLRAA